MDAGVDVGIRRIPGLHLLRELDEGWVAVRDGELDGRSLLVHEVDRAPVGERRDGKVREAIEEGFDVERLGEQRRCFGQERRPLLARPELLLESLLTCDVAVVHGAPQRASVRCADGRRPPVEDPAVGEHHLVAPRETRIGADGVADLVEDRWVGAGLRHRDVHLERISLLEHVFGVLAMPQHAIGDPERQRRGFHEAGLELAVQLVIHAYKAANQPVHALMHRIAFILARRRRGAGGSVGGKGRKGRRGV